MNAPVLTQERRRELEKLAVQARRLVVESIHHAGAGHLGGSLSATDLLIALYFEVMKVDPSQPRDPSRDRFILSKGHASIGLYTVLALRGYLPVDELESFDAIGSRLQGHPDMTRLPGLDMSTGSLGQGLSPGVGMALAGRLQGRDYQTWVLMGDGDSQEGQIWEAAFVARRYNLGSLKAILDWNGLQQYGWATEAGYGDPARQPAQEEPAAKWRAFGWAVLEIDGHDFTQIVEACNQVRAICDRPAIIIARTVKAKGIAHMENDFNWHAKPPADDDLRLALSDLATQEAAL